MFRLVASGLMIDSVRSNAISRSVPFFNAGAL
jgi:hypothetical protein